MSTEFTFKLLLIGDASVGKTTLTFRYIKEVYIPDPRLTIGVDFYSKKIRLKNSGQTVKLQIWDFGGENRFRFLLPTYSKNANACFFVFDLTRKETLESIDDWLKVVYENAGEIPVVLVGAKSDLEGQREVSYEEGENVAKDKGLKSYIELSSKTGDNIEASFDIISQLLSMEVDKRSKE